MDTFWCRETFPFVVFQATSCSPQLLASTWEPAVSLRECDYWFIEIEIKIFLINYAALLKKIKSRFLPFKHLFCSGSGTSLLDICTLRNWGCQLLWVEQHQIIILSMNAKQVAGTRPSSDWISAPPQKISLQRNHISWNERRDCSDRLIKAVHRWTVKEHLLEKLCCSGEGAGQYIMHLQKYLCEHLLFSACWWLMILYF